MADQSHRVWLQPADAKEYAVYHHGRTPAATYGSIIAAVGFLVATVGFLMNINWIVVWLGFALVGVAGVVAWALKKMGKGQSYATKAPAH